MIASKPETTVLVPGVAIYMKGRATVRAAGTERSSLCFIIIITRVIPLRHEEYRLACTLSKSIWRVLTFEYK
jgi:hypothetical protein